MGQRTSVYLDDALQSAVKASGIPLSELVRRGLAAGHNQAVCDTRPTPATAPSLAALPDGEGCPGVACAGPGCWQRDTARYGLRRIPLCTACRAALEGGTCQREIPPGAARTLRKAGARAQGHDRQAPEASP